MAVVGTVFVAVVYLLSSVTILAQPKGGPDLSLEAIVPESESEAVSVGLAGDDPASIARYLSARGAEAAELSPDGESVAIRYSATGVPQLWVLQQGRRPKQITFGNGITFFRWSPLGNQLIYGADNNGDGREAYYLISSGGEVENLLVPAVPRGFRVFGDFSADGLSIVFASTERNGLDFDLYQADLATGEVRMLREGKYSQLPRSLAPDNRKLLVAETVGEDANNLYLFDMESGDFEELLVPDPRSSSARGGLQWTPDSKGFYGSTNNAREYSALVYFNLESKRFKVIEEPGRDVQNVSLCAQGKYLLWTTNVDGYFEIAGRDLSTGMPLTIPNVPQGFVAISCAKNRARAAIRVNGWRTPGDVILWDLDTGNAATVFSSNMAGLNTDRLIRPESIRMKARDGIEVQGLLYLPDKQSRSGSKLPPVVFEVHGGPVGQSMAVFDPIAQFYVDRGLAVFKPNVRGSLGFGRTYLTLDDRERRLDSVRDLVDMLKFLEKSGLVDTQRAAVSGQSYGGYMVNAVLAAFPEVFRAGVSRYGVADWITALQIAPPALKASDRIEYGDITEPHWQEFYRVNSPIRHADAIKVPVLYSHGINDTSVDILETETMVKALRANGIEAPYIRFRDEGHGWRKLSNRLFYFRREAMFLEEQLLKRPAMND